MIPVGNVDLFDEAIEKVVASAEKAGEMELATEYRHFLSARRTIAQFLLKEGHGDAAWILELLQQWAGEEGRK